MQHLDVAAQVATKQRALEDALWHLGKVRPERVLRPMRGPDWHYRQRARLSVRHVVKKSAVLVGFHERKSSFVAEIRSCDVVPRHVSALILPLRALIAAMAARDRLPQIELAAGDGVTALVLRHLAPLGDDDLRLLREFARRHGIEWWLQAKGPDSAHPLDGAESALAYRLPEFGLHMPFRPTDFTQVNHEINEALVSRAVRLLATGADDFVIDWFCGLGNFTLPLATRAGRVLGIEGSATLVARATAAAALNGLAAKASFAVRNLFEMSADDLVAIGSASKWLIDPPREGAFAIAKALADRCAGTDGVPVAAPWRPPARIVYVSCNPATLARDAGLLVHRAGYRCSAAGVINMFPHTAHVESIAVFDRDEERL
jgi:23S rRNA (uracil1939-C5)-methyltransferase